MDTVGATDAPAASERAQRHRRLPTPIIQELDQDQQSTDPELALFNDLGAEGWELVSREITSSTVGHHLGLAAASWPVATKTLFKRPAL